MSTTIITTRIPPPTWQQDYCKCRVCHGEVSDKAAAAALEFQEKPICSVRCGIAEYMAKYNHFSRTVALIALLALLVGCKTGPLSRESHIARRVEQIGPNDYCVNLFTTVPQTAFQFFMQEMGLTNKHAVYIDSHGVSVGGCFRLMPDRDARLVAPSGYSFRHIADALPGGAATNIHNVYVAACDTGRAFRTSDVLRAFPNATNVVHITPGHQGFVTSFEEAIMYFEGDAPFGLPYIHKPYWEDWETGERFAEDDWRNTCDLVMPYVADLFRPGEKKPFKRVIATRDLLQPNPHRLDPYRME